jgi:hypothetical protein
MRQTTTKAIPVATATAKRLAEIAQGVAEDLEPIERAEAQRLGFNFSPSPVLRAARYFAAVAKDFTPYPTASCKPSHMVPFNVGE